MDKKTNKTKPFYIQLSSFVLSLTIMTAIKPKLLFCRQILIFFFFFYFSAIFLIKSVLSYYWEVIG